MPALTSERQGSRKSEGYAGDGMGSRVGSNLNDEGEAERELLAAQEALGPCARHTVSDGASESAAETSSVRGKWVFELSYRRWGRASSTAGDAHARPRGRSTRRPARSLPLNLSTTHHHRHQISEQPWAWLFIFVMVRIEVSETEAGPGAAVETAATTLARRSLEELSRSTSALSSAMMPSLGNASEIVLHTMACTAKSPTVTCRRCPHSRKVSDTGKADVERSCSESGKEKTQELDGKTTYRACVGLAHCAFFHANTAHAHTKALS
eukprot:3223485-Rhodomonas_salina.2